jgi:hypothetical protein
VPGSGGRLFGGVKSGTAGLAPGLLGSGCGLGSPGVTMTAVDGVDAGPVPAALVAVTANV